MTEGAVRRVVLPLLRGLWRAARRLVYASYLLVFRSALYVLALWLVAYFFVNSTHFRGVFEPAMSVVFDGGRMEAARWRWGPIPWQGGAIDIRFLTPEGRPVIEAAWADGAIDLPDLLGWVVDSALLGGDEPFRIHVTRGEAHGFIVRLDFDETGHLALVDAFSAPDDGDEWDDLDDGDDVLVRISNAKASDGRVLLRFPAWSLDADVEDAEAEIVVADEVRVGSRLVSVRRAQGVVHLPGDGPDGAPSRLEPRLGRTHVQGFRWLGDGLDVVRVRSTVDDAMRLDATGALSFAADTPSFHGIARLEADELPAVGRALLGDAIAGSFTVVASGTGSFDDVEAAAVVRSPGAVVDGTPVADVGAAFRLAREPVTPGDARYVVRVPLATAGVDGGLLRVEELVWRPDWLSDPVAGPAGVLPVSHLLTARLALRDADIGAWLGRLGVTAAPAPTRGRATGTIDVRAGRFAHADGDTWQLDAALAATMGWDGGGRWPVASRYDLDGGVRFLERAETADDEGRRRPAGDLAVLGRDLRIRSGRDELRLDGGVSLATGALALSASGGLASVRGLAAALGFADVDGRLRVQDARLGGDLAAPAADARVQLDGFVVGGRRLGSLATSLSLQGGGLRLRRLTADGPWGRLEGAASLQALPGPAAPDGPRPPPVGRFTIEDLRGEELDLERLLPGGGLGGTARVSVGRLTGDVDAPLTSLRGDGRVTIRGLRVEGERFRRFDATLDANARTVALHDVRATLARGGRVTGDLTWDKRSGRLLAEAHVPPLPLDTFASLGLAGGPFEAELGLDVRVEGAPADPAVEGRVLVRGARARLARRDGGQWLRFGDADILFERPEGGDATLRSPSFFPGFRLLDGSRVTVRGGVPREAVVRVRADDWDPARVLPVRTREAVEAVDAEAAVTAEGELRADLRSGDWRVDVAAPVGGLRFRLQDGRIEYVNPEPLDARVGAAGVVLPGLVLAGSDGSRIVACGGIDGDGALDLAVSGDVTAAPIRALFRRVFSRLEGRLRVTGGADRRPAACGPGVLWEGGGAMLVGGAAGSPELLGRVELLGLQMQPRGFGREVSLTRPAVLHVAPGRPGVTRVSIPRHEAVAGLVEDGTFALWGWAELRDFVPSGGQLEFEGTDLYYSAAKTFNVTFNPRLAFTFSHMDDPERRTSALTGDIDVTEGAYYRSFDTLARAFGGALSREQATPTRSLARAVPALADTALDLRVTGQNVSVTSGFTFGTTDLELRIDVKVRGTLADPLIYDRIDIVPGGLITYKIVRREFEVVRGALDFRGDPDRPRLDVEARTEIEYYEDRMGTLTTIDTAPLDDERVVTITIEAEGTYPDIGVELRSDERGWDQADLQSFILTGAPASSTRGARAARSINLFTDDLANLAHKLLLSAFVDAMTLGVTPEGGIDWGVIASLGRNLKVRTRIIQQGADKQYRAKFEFRITERLSLEGQLKVNEEENESIKTYESKLRYRIPLD